jgi:serpin B
MMKRSRLFLLLGVLTVGVSAGESAKPAPPAVVEGNTAFSVDLYTRLKDQPGNLFFSPHSISTALAMTYAGARGETETQMARTLHFDLPQEALHPCFARLQKDLAGRQGCELAIANRLWGQKGALFLDAFLGITRDHYGAGLEPLDFASDTEGSRKTINAWVETETRDRIKGLLKPKILSPNTQLVLTNAIYFKGKWRKEFEKKNTEVLPFFVSKDREVKAPLMAQKGLFLYAEREDLQLLELPYVGDALSMVVLLPTEKNGLAALEAALTGDALKGWLAGLAPCGDVEVFLPRFKMTSDFSLGDTLAAMGMPLAFSGGADFSGMTGDRSLFISAVVHKAFVAVDEEGTEAAAATAVVMDCKCELPPSPTFRADHPFLFLIRDRGTGAVLFMGRVADPTA